ncbi:hypothetical protein G6F24_018027 [Rhizopus arrhizus]|nr:hypothetical protein G6F24_018027 [Rhizopus arrhizus]
MFRATGAVMRWSLGDPLDLEAQVPGLRLRSEQWLYEESDATQWARYSWPARATIWLMRRGCGVSSAAAVRRAGCGRARRPRGPAGAGPPLHAAAGLSAVAAGR